MITNIRDLECSDVVQTQDGLCGEVSGIYFPTGLFYINSNPLIWYTLADIKYRKPHNKIKINIVTGEIEMPKGY
jgi:hypothetical protein